MIRLLEQSKTGHEQRRSAGTIPPPLLGLKRFYFFQINLHRCIDLGEWVEENLISFSPQPPPLHIPTFSDKNAAHSLPLKNNMISDNMSAFDIEAADDEDETFENMYAFEYPELPICSLCNNLTTANCHHTGLGMTNISTFVLCDGSYAM